MGAGQSTGRGDAGGDVEIKTSYYELLGIERQATEDEIKKAYRRKALELHPDRNHGNEENATALFAEIQTAHEILSDPQERAWYDSHESAILRGDDGTASNDAPTYQNVRVTSADDLARMVRKFNSNVEFSDAPSGFFGFIRETFEQLANEEEAAANWDGGESRDYPSFGHKDDAYDDVVKRFYAAWSNFATIKSFAWRDKWKLSEAPDRYVRRLMEKENREVRKEGVKEFNEAVRSFAAFVRKRDPRFVPSTQSEEERQKTLRDAAASQAARARAANQEKLNAAVPEWTKVREPEELEESEEEEEDLEVFECVACNKVFKSEKQWEAHEKSKKHQKAIYALQKKMRKENAHLDLDDSEVGSGVVTPAIDEDEEEDIIDDVATEVEDQEARQNGKTPSDDGQHNDDIQDEAADGQDSGSDTAAAKDPDQAGMQDNQDSKQPSDSEDSDYATPETIASRLQQSSLDTPASTPSDADEASNDNEQATSEQQPAQAKVGKAKLKKAKKAAAAAATEEAAGTHACATCNATFPSKTRLFQHIKDHGHAALKPAAAGAGGGKGKKGKGKR